METYAVSLLFPPGDNGLPYDRVLTPFLICEQKHDAAQMHVCVYFFQVKTGSCFLIES